MTTKKHTTDNGACPSRREDANANSNPPLGARPSERCVPSIRDRCRSILRRCMFAQGGSYTTFAQRTSCWRYRRCNPRGEESTCKWWRNDARGPATGGTSVSWRPRPTPRSAVGERSERRRVPRPRPSRQSRWSPTAPVRYGS